MPEVGVAVDEDQPDPAADVLAEPVHGQRRRRAAIEQSPPRTSGNSPASRIAPIRSASRREYARDLGRVATPSPGRQSPGSYRGGVRQPASRALQPGEQAVVAQRAGRLGAARHRRRGRRAQAEVGRRVQDGDPAHRRAGR